MPKKNLDLAGRAWNLLRIALLWARKGGALRRRLLVDLRLLPKYLKSLRRANGHDAIHYREREFSFDETPIFHFKMHRPSSKRFHMPNIPCIKPQVDFDFDFDFNSHHEEDFAYNQDARKSFLRGDERDEYYDGGDDGRDTELVSCGDEGIDLKAEEFIAKFYDQMKLQRQISYLQYNEMLSRGTS
ncbi:hypothetical protein HHK36_020845 [Tetracentron sinense]|uniref:Cotton fiber protein n=1 Tax=Tetracentron sinense TaxID=13715 RepID=A0A834YXS2_TETSI|nr:hypothetical protein HHK36_020845 [Tetracentron sinense]